MRTPVETILVFLALMACTLPFHAPSAQAVHETAGKVQCLECHAWLPLDNEALSFREGAGAVCTECHRKYHGKDGSPAHPANIFPSMVIPKDMPLDAKGKIICVTCHRFHTGYRDADGKKQFFLRRSAGKTFCYSCHKKRLF